MFRSLRWRLTGWYLLVLPGVLAMFSAGTYLATRAALLENFDEVLGDQAALIAQAVDVDDGIPQLKQEVLLSGHRDDDHFTRLYDATGTLVFDDTQDGPHVPDLPPTIRKALSGDKDLTQAQTESDTLRVATFPILQDGQVVGALQVGVSLADIEATLRTLLNIL